MSTPSAPPPRVGRVFLVDMDNTLSDNDAIKRDLQYAIVDLLGRGHGNRFWAIYESVREDHDYVDFPGTLERFHWSTRTSTAWTRSPSCCGTCRSTSTCTPARWTPSRRCRRWGRS
jgi:hypothetical protein